MKFDGKFLKVFTKEYNNINYEIVSMNDAVAVLVMNKDKDKIMLVKQYRPAVDKFTYEIPAGMLDIENENEAACIVRELVEEADIYVDEANLVFLTKYVPIIGSVQHEISLFYILVEESDDKEIENDDVVERVWVDLKDFEDLVAQGEIVDGKTLLAYNMFKNKRALG